MWVFLVSHLLFEIVFVTSMLQIYLPIKWSKCQRYKELSILRWHIIALCINFGFFINKCLGDFPESLINTPRFVKPLQYLRFRFKTLFSCLFFSFAWQGWWSYIQYNQACGIDNRLHSVTWSNVYDSLCSVTWPCTHDLPVRCSPV